MGLGVEEGGQRDCTLGSEPSRLMCVEGTTVPWEGGFTVVPWGLLRAWGLWGTLGEGTRPAGDVEGVGVQLTHELSKLRGEKGPSA